MAELTPMMKQYLEIKKDNPDSILFFRLGDFYEMFADDAKLASKELDLTLTSRDHGKHAKPEEERVPMCGIPYHASEAYIARLIGKGYKVAICEQMEDPATAKGLVKRDIIRVVTPGTVIDAACLEDKSSNFLCGIYLDSQAAGAAFCADGCCALPGALLTTFLPAFMTRPTAHTIMMSAIIACNAIPPSSQPGSEITCRPCSDPRSSCRCRRWPRASSCRR